MTIGTMLRQWLVKLEWFSTLFPRIPVPIQQKIQKHLEVSTDNIGFKLDIGFHGCYFNFTDNFTDKLYIIILYERFNIESFHLK